MWQVTLWVGILEIYRQKSMINVFVLISFAGFWFVDETQLNLEIMEILILAMFVMEMLHFVVLMMLFVIEKLIDEHTGTLDSG